MSQTPVHLRPKAKRTFHWEDTKAPAKPAGRRKRERTREHRAHPHLRQIALALGMTVKQVDNSLYRSKRLLREKLSQAWGGAE